MFIIVALASYLAFWPVPIEPRAWQAPQSPGYTGVHAANSKLAGLQRIALDGEAGPEHVAVGPDGKLYASVASGHILRMNADGSGKEVFSTTGGRPLGIAFDAAGGMVVADSVRGLLSIAPDGSPTLLANEAAGQAIGVANGVAVASSGKVYFTDTSSRFPGAHWGQEGALLDVFEQSCTGRVLEYDPRASSVRVVAHGLCFANGIVLSADEQSLFVSESTRYRVLKIAVAAAQLDVSAPSSQASVVLDKLPGYPDNLTRGLDGRIWLGLAGPRNMLDQMAGHPWMRKLALRIPRVLWRMPKPYGHVIAFTEDGKVVADLQDPSGDTRTTTGATETVNGLYIHSVDATSIGWRPRQ